MIELENIRVEFGDFVAVPNLSLRIEQGEFFTLLGPSGCGKTTVLRALAGLNELASGKVIIEGKNVTNLPSDKRQVGMVFQNYALFPSMSVEDNIAYGLKVAKIPKTEREERVHAIAKEVELNDHQLSKSIGALSGGQQQRVAIARALVMRPKILLLDEPLSNLDAKLRAQLRVQLKDMQEHFGITSVYVTHDQEEALTMSDRLAVLRDGYIEQVGTPRQIYSHSATEFVCNFIGEANLLPRVLLTHHGVDTSADSSSYVREERIELLEPSAVTAPGHITLDGVVEGQRYEGTVTIYLVRIGSDTVVRALEKEDGRENRKAGDRVKVVFPADALLSYRNIKEQDAQ